MTAVIDQQQLEQVPDREQLTMAKIRELYQALSSPDCQSLVDPTLMADWLSTFYPGGDGQLERNEIITNPESTDKYRYFLLEALKYVDPEDLLHYKSFDQRFFNRLIRYTLNKVENGYTPAGVVDPVIASAVGFVPGTSPLDILEYVGLEAGHPGLFLEDTDGEDVEGRELPPGSMIPHELYVVDLQRSAEDLGKFMDGVAEIIQSSAEQQAPEKFTNLPTIAQMLNLVSTMKERQVDMMKEMWAAHPVMVQIIDIGFNLQRILKISYRYADQLEPEEIKDIRRLMDSIVNVISYTMAHSTTVDFEQALADTLPVIVDGTSVILETLQKQLDTNAELDAARSEVSESAQVHDPIRLGPNNFELINEALTRITELSEQLGREAELNRQDTIHGVEEYLEQLRQVVPVKLEEALQAEAARQAKKDKKGEQVVAQATAPAAPAPTPPPATKPTDAPKPAEGPVDLHALAVELVMADVKDDKEWLNRILDKNSQALLEKLTAFFGEIDPNVPLRPIPDYIWLDLTSGELNKVKRRIVAWTGDGWGKYGNSNTAALRKFISEQAK